MKVIMLSIACREEGTVWIVKKQHDVPCLLLLFCSSFNSLPSDLWCDKVAKLFFFQRTNFCLCVSLETGFFIASFCQEGVQEL